MTRFSHSDFQRELIRVSTRLDIAFGRDVASSIAMSRQPCAIGVLEEARAILRGSGNEEFVINCALMDTDARVLAHLVTLEGRLN